MSYIYEKKSLKMTTLQVVFNAGALYEKAGQYGTMHLMEHIICKTFEDLQSTLTKECISWNAYTGDEHVVFHWTGMDSHLTPELKKILVDRILGSLDSISEEAFNTERNTVIQEYFDCFNDPVTGAYLNELRTRYDYYDAIGRHDDIVNFSFADAKNIKLEFFTKPARIIEVGPSKTDFSYVDFEKEKHEYKKISCSKKSVNGKDFDDVENCPESCNKSIVMNIGTKRLSKKDYPLLNIAIKMLTSGLDSPLYKEARVKRGLTYSCRGGITPFIDEGIYSLYATTTTDHEAELISVYKDVLSNLDKYMTEERFLDVMSALKIAQEQRKILRYSHVDDLVRLDCLRMPKSLSKITFDKVLAVAKKYLQCIETTVLK